jgi:hypothetical protein
MRIATGRRHEIAHLRRHSTCSLARMHAKASLAVMLLSAACGTTIAVTPINPSPRPLRARPPETVELFTSGPPLRPFVDVAYLEAEQESHLSAHGTREFFDQLRARGAAIGCDALVIGGKTNRTTVSIDLKTPANIRGMTATCIVYTAPIEHAVAAGAPR